MRTPPAQPRRVQGRRDPSLSAVVVQRTPLFYSDGPDPMQDRPGHVRAGSSLTWFGKRLALVQDDANFLALIDSQTGRVDAAPLPSGEGGARQFDDRRGTKRFKLDLEACVATSSLEGEMLLAFGSGSSPRRETIAVIFLADELRVTLHPAPDFYRALREQVAFAGSELNVEGAVVADDYLRLFNRGNGAARGVIQPVNATAEVRWSEFYAWLRGDSRTPPQIHKATQYDLGAMGGQRLGFTDATVTAAGMIFSAAAEDSPDAVRDGRVAGSALGVFDREELRWIELCNPGGEIVPTKVEGLCIAAAAGDRVYVVIDADDPDLPTELCEVKLSGPWATDSGRRKLDVDIQFEFR